MENLKKYYTKKEVCYNIYDLQNNEMCIASFDTLQDLYNYLQDNKHATHKTKITSIASLKSMMSQHKLINDRLEIVKICL